MTLLTTLGAMTILIVAGAGPAFGQPPAAGSETLAGTVRDVSGAVMQAVSVRVFTDGAGADAAPVQEAVTDADGGFSVVLPPGTYRVEVSAPAFTTVSRAVALPARAPLEVMLDLDVIDLSVEVVPGDDPLADVTASLSSTTLSGDELLDLPRNEEDLATYLLMLAGADLTGDLEEDILAHFEIDGFEDGRLPSPDQIAQIVIDPESLRAGSGGRPRIQIVTRPGTGRWRGSVNVGFADESLNARAPGEMQKEPRRTRDVEFRLDAPVIPNLLEMTLQVSRGQDDRAADSLRAITAAGDLFAGVVRPERDHRVQVGARLQLNATHRLDVQFRSDAQRSSNRGVGGFRLPERGSDRTQDSWQLQVGERMVRRTLTNNLRLQVSHRASADVPMREGFAIDVADAFMGGGGTTRGRSDDLRVRVDDTLRWTRGPWNVQAGGHVQYQRRTSSNRNNYNGTFEFSSLHDYCYAIGFQGSNCAATERLVSDAAASGAAPTYLDARGREHRITGLPTTFTQAFGEADLEFTQVSFDTHVQADRRFGRRASLGMGVRYNGTSHSLDYLRVNPSASLRYQLTPTTLVNAGVQLNVQDFTDRERLLRHDGSTRQSELVISAPSFPDPFEGGEIEYSDETASLWILSPDYRSPYSVSPQVSVTQQVPGNVRLTLSYNTSYGRHQRRTRNINAPYPGTPLPDEILDLPRSERQEIVDRMRPMYPYVGNVTQIETTGRSQSRMVRIRVQPRGTVGMLGLGLSGSLNYSYRLGWDDNDFNNPYLPEWGLSRRDHDVQSQFRIRLPRATFDQPLLRTIARATWDDMNLNFNLRANTGRLYSIRSGRDLNGDQSSSDRPPGVPRNTEVGPGSWTLNMTVTKEYRLTGAGARTDDRRERRPSGPSLRFQARVNNLFNHSHPRAYGSVVTSPLFGRPTGYTGARTMDLSMRVAF
jgi:hypothetical protein